MTIHVPTPNAADLSKVEFAMPAQEPQQMDVSYKADAHLQYDMETKALLAHLESLRRCVQLDNRHGELKAGDLTAYTVEIIPVLIERLQALEASPYWSEAEGLFAHAGFLYTLVDEHPRLYITRGQYICLDL